MKIRVFPSPVSSFMGGKDFLDIPLWIREEVGAGEIGKISPFMPLSRAPGLPSCWI